MRILALLMWAAWLLGCAPRMPASHLPLAAKATEGPLWAGAARADITPPPGVSTFGHGPDARVANGYWTRLYCRAFYLETEAAKGLALVSCDLPAISGLLVREVAARVRDVVPTARLMISAIHTHAGPAHYFDAESYNGQASAHFPGFDPLMVDFLAGRIAAAVRKAHLVRRPAVAAWGYRQVWGLTRNRAIVPHRSNPDYARYLKAPSSLPAEQRAVDPELHVLRLDAIEPSGAIAGPIGALAFYAMHPTVLPSSNRAFGADTHGVTARAVEREMRREWAGSNEAGRGASCSGGCPDPLLAIFNTNEGDVVPVKHEPTSAEAIRVGLRWAAEVWGAFDAAAAQSERQLLLDSRYLELELPNAPVPASSFKLCSQGELGVGLARGGSDHLSLLSPLLPSEQRRFDLSRTDCQAPKRPLLGTLQKILAGDYTQPAHVALAVVRLGDRWLTFVPAEMTVVAGARLKRGVRRAAGTGTPVVVGLSNGYIQYVTTAEEYRHQYYEGASTLYGPSSARFLAAHAERLAGVMAGKSYAGWPPRPLNEATAYRYGVGPQRRRFPRPEDEPSYDDLRRLRRPLGLCRPRGYGGGDGPPVICFWWRDAGPGRVPLASGPWLELVGHGGRPLRVAQPALVGVAGISLVEPVDDRGFAFHTRAHQPQGGARVWSTSLRPSAALWRALAQPLEQGVHIRVRAPNGQEPILSRSFTRRQCADFAEGEEHTHIDYCTMVEAREYCGLTEL